MHNAVKIVGVLKKVKIYISHSKVFVNLENGKWIAFSFDNFIYLWSESSDSYELFMY